MVQFKGWYVDLTKSEIGSEGSRIYAFYLEDHSQIK